MRSFWLIVICVQLLGHKEDMSGLVEIPKRLRSSAVVVAQKNYHHQGKEPRHKKRNPDSALIQGQNLEGIAGWLC